MSLPIKQQEGRPHGLDRHPSSTCCCKLSGMQSLEDKLCDSAVLQGAVYVTDNGAYTWQAAVQETVDATLNRTVSSGELPALFKGLFFSKPTEADVDLELKALGCCRDQRCFLL